MKRVLGYALAFGVGIGAGKFFQWKPISSGPQTPGSAMTAKGIY